MTARRHVLLAAALPAGILLSGALVWQASSAAFTASAGSAANSWTAGSVSLTTGAGSSAAMTVSGMTPGVTGAGCVTVTYTGTVAAEVHLYATYTDADANGTADADALAPYVAVTVEDGTGGNAACTGFTSAGVLFDGTRPVASAGTMQRLVAAHGTYATGLGTWRAGPGGTTTRTYKVSYRLADDNAAQGRNVLVDLRWEAQSVTP